MNDKLRSVNTRFWDDTFISELSPNEKLLFLYLITNPLTNLLGIYEITMKRICFDTGLKTDIIQKGFERFGRVKKVFFVDNFIILPNWLKNQRLNTNMKIAVNKEFKSLPDKLKINILGNDSEGLLNGSEGFGMVRERLGKYEIEIESEIESEIEEGKGNKKRFIPPTLNEWINYFEEKGYKKNVAERSWEAYNVADWFDSTGKKVKNWKQKAINVWFKDENKISIKDDWIKDRIAEIKKRQNE